MISYEGLILTLKILAWWFGFNIAFVAWRLWATSAIHDAEERRWMKLHPGMSLSRRPR